MCSRAVNTSNSGSGGPVLKPRPSRCFLRQGTLLHFVSLHPGVKKGTGDILLWGNPAMDQHPVQGGVAILLGLLHATETGYKLRPCQPLALVRLYFCMIGDIRKFHTPSLWRHLLLKYIDKHLGSFAVEQLSLRSAFLQACGIASVQLSYFFTFISSDRARAALGRQKRLCQYFCSTTVVER